MPLLWKIYYLFSLYLVLWCVAAFIFLSYVFFDGELKSNTDFKSFSIVLSVVLLLAFKAVLSIRGISHYKNTELLSKTERIMFIITFFANALFATATLLYCIFSIFPHLFAPRARHNYDDLEQEYINRVMIFSTFSLLLCCTFLSAFDLFLLKAVRKKYYNSLLVLGEGIDGLKEGQL